jgi:hypothetical protein
MFSHIMIGANDIDASKKFYDAVLGALGIPKGTQDDKGRVFYITPTGIFAITKPIDGSKATAANGGRLLCCRPLPIRAAHPWSCACAEMVAT